MQISAEWTRLMPNETLLLHASISLDYSPQNFWISHDKNIIFMNCNLLTQDNKLPFMNTKQRSFDNNAYPKPCSSYLTFSDMVNNFFLITWPYQEPARWKLEKTAPQLTTFSVSPHKTFLFDSEHDNSISPPSPSKKKTKETKEKV